MIGGFVRKMLGLPRSDDLHRFEVVSDAAPTEADFVSELRGALGEGTLMTAYLFRANINDVSDALVFGFVPGWRGPKGSIDTVKEVDAIWKRVNPRRQLAIVPLNPGMAEQVTAVCQPLA
jgi:hypothetical protein